MEQPTNNPTTSTRFLRIPIWALILLAFLNGPITSSAEQNGPADTKTARGNSLAVSDDPFLHDIERWKQRSLALASFIALLIAIAVGLLIEVAGAVEIWRVKFGAPRPCGDGSAA